MTQQQVERELGWDDTIERDGGGEYVLLAPGDYNFTVTKFERARFQGSANLPPCNQAKLEITIHSPEHGDVIVFHNLFLHTKTEGLLSAFFTAIGQKKKGEPLRMNWNTVVGSKGRCQIEHNKYTKDGREYVNNQIKRFYPYEDYLKHVQQATVQATQQQSYQQPLQQQYQQPFPTEQQGGWQQGQF